MEKLENKIVDPRFGQLTRSQNMNDMDERKENNVMTKVKKTQ